MQDLNNTTIDSLAYIDIHSKLNTYYIQTYNEPIPKMNLNRLQIETKLLTTTTTDLN